MIELRPERLPEGAALRVGEAATQPSSVGEDAQSGETSPGAGLVLGPAPGQIAVTANRLGNGLPEWIGLRYRQNPSRLRRPGRLLGMLDPLEDRFRHLGGDF
ncbi:MAG: hypothetical protein ACREOS_12925, partial [Candidatus Dormibacteraceae bacterium]